MKQLIEHMPIQMSMPIYEWQSFQTKVLINITMISWCESVDKSGQWNRHYYSIRKNHT